MKVILHSCLYDLLLTKSPATLYYNCLKQKQWGQPTLICRGEKKSCWCLDLFGWPLEEGIKSLDFKGGHTVSDPMFRCPIFNRLYSFQTGPRRDLEFYFNTSICTIIPYLTTFLIKEGKIKTIQRTNMKWVPSLAAT